MADIKTHLRELSVGLPFYSKTKNITPQVFLKFCKDNIKGTSDLRLEQIGENAEHFNANELNIINRGIELGHAIHKNIFKLKKVNTITWTGFKTQSGIAADLIINDELFSLKEESFILENMGLYNYLNLILNENKYNRGLHCFEKFAPSELEKWFEAARDSIINGLESPFSYTGRNYNSTGKLDDNTLILTYKGIEKRIPNFNNSTYQIYKDTLDGKFKEKVFSKMMKRYSESDDNYMKEKKICASRAGLAIENLLKDSIGTTPNIKGWFRIEDRKYYYCKITDNSLNILEVPNEENFNKSIIVKTIKSSVPKHQLNIITTLINTNNNITFQFRNECRYSHGQLNGTPESKCYYVDKADKLEFAYKKII